MTDDTDGILRGINERKRDEEELTRHAALIDLSPDGIMARQLDGTITFWSRGEIGRAHV